MSTQRSVPVTAVGMSAVDAAPTKEEDQTTEKSDGKGSKIQTSLRANEGSDIPNLEAIVASNPQIYDMLRRSIAGDVFKRVEENRTHSRNINLALAGVLIAALLGAGGFLGRVVIKDQVEGQLREEDFLRRLDTAVQARITNEINAKLNDARFLASVASLNSETVRLDREPAFAEQQASRLIDRVASLYQQGRARPCPVRC